MPLLKQRVEACNFIAGDGDVPAVLRNHGRTDLLICRAAKTVFLRHEAVFEDVERSSIGQRNHLLGSLDCGITGECRCGKRAQLSLHC